MNHSVFVLEEFEVDKLRAFEALQCLCHTVAYTRALGTLRQPRFTECNTLPLTYAACASETLSTDIDKSLAEFLNSLRRISPGERRGCLSVCFHARPSARGGGSTQGHGSGSNGARFNSSGGRGRSGSIEPKGGKHVSSSGRRGLIFEEWRINIVVSDEVTPASPDLVYEAARKRKDAETVQTLRRLVMHIAKEAAASETKLPDDHSTALVGHGGGGGGGAQPDDCEMPFDFVLQFQGRPQAKQSESALSRGLKSFARSFFG